MPLIEYVTKCSPAAGDPTNRGSPRYRDTPPTDSPTADKVHNGGSSQLQGLQQGECCISFEPCELRGQRENTVVVENLVRCGACSHGSAPCDVGCRTRNRVSLGNAVSAAVSLALDEAHSDVCVLPTVSPSLYEACNGGSVSGAASTTSHAAHVSCWAHSGEQCRGCCLSCKPHQVLSAAGLVAAGASAVGAQDHDLRLFLHWQ